MEQVKLWITDEDGSVIPLVIRDRIEYEHLLEDMLVARPDMLGDGAALVGRQLMTAGGPLDLLGVDQDGKLVVYELKRGLTPREALTQAIDYASWLDTLAYEELDRRISDHRPNGIARGFDDFDDWYSDQFAEDQVQNLRPTRIVLVGLGIESNAERMAQWLSDKGVDIQAIAFHAFEHEGHTVLARQLEVSPDDVGRVTMPSSSRSDPFSRAAEFDAEAVMRSGYELVDSCFAGTPYRIHTFKNGFNFALPPTDDRKIRRFPGYVGVFVRTESAGMINVVIRPDAVKVCLEESAKLEREAQSLGAQVSQYVDPVSGDKTVWLGVDAETLRTTDPRIVEFAKSAIAAWQRDWDRWNASATSDDPDIAEVATTSSALPTNTLDRSEP